MLYSFVVTALWLPETGLRGKKGQRVRWGNFPQAAPIQRLSLWGKCSIKTKTEKDGGRKKENGREEEKEEKRERKKEKQLLFSYIPLEWPLTQAWMQLGSSLQLTPSRTTVVSLVSLHLAGNRCSSKKIKPFGLLSKVYPGSNLAKNKIWINISW